MKPYLILLLSLFAFASHGQSIVLSNMNIVMPAMAKPSDSIMSVGVQCQLTAPLEGATVVVLAGTDKDRSEAGLVQCSFHLKDKVWQLVPAVATYNNSSLLVAVPVALKRFALARQLTLYMTDSKGQVISNKLYLTVPGN